MRARAAALVAVCILGWNAQAQIAAPPFPLDTPMRMRAIEAVCTGVSADARNDPRWSNYPLRIEVVDGAGRYLSDAQVTVTKADEPLASVNCQGPWVLFNLPAGAYSVSAELGGMTKSGRVNVGAAGQARLILRFDAAAK